MKAKLAFVCVCVLFVTGSALAQTPRPAPGPHHDPIGEALFPPELVMRHQQAIDLQPEQKTYIRDEMRKAQTRFTELQWQLQDAMESLVAVLEQTPVNESQALAQLEKILDTERQVKTLQITLMVRIKNKLTPEQQAQLRELRPAAPEAPPPPF